jgi:cysteine protease ATG4
MTSLPDRGAAQPSDLEQALRPAVASSSSSSEQREQGSASKQSILSGVFTPPFAIFERNQDSTCGAKSPSSSSSGSYGWSRILRRIVCSGSMWRLLGCNKVLTSSDVWFLGKCYKEEPESTSNSDPHIAHSEFLQDFSSRIWITYRKGYNGFDAWLRLLISFAGMLLT